MMEIAGCFFCIMGDKVVYTNTRPNIHARLNNIYKLHAKQSMIAKNRNHTNDTPSQEKHEVKDDNRGYENNGTATMKQDGKVGTIQKILHHPGRHT